MTVTEDQRKEIHRILKLRQSVVGGQVKLREDQDSKFVYGSKVKLVLNDWGEYLENPKTAVVLVCYSQENSKYGDYPEMYILEFEDGKVEGGYHSKYLLRNEDVIL